jgi:hypothetical protein
MNDRLKQIKFPKRPKLVVRGLPRQKKYWWTLQNTNGKPANRSRDFKSLHGCKENAELTVALAHGMTRREWQQKKPESVRIEVNSILLEEERALQRQLRAEAQVAPSDGGFDCDYR